MNHYITTGKVQLFTGEVQLTDAQASVRMHALEKVEDGAYRITAPIEFMAGETIGYDGEIPLETAESLVAAAPDRDEKPPVREAPVKGPAVKPRRRR